MCYYATVDWVIYIIKNFTNCTVHKMYLTYEIKRDVVGGALGIFVGGKNVQKLVWGPEVNRSLGGSRIRWEE